MIIKLKANRQFNQEWQLTFFSLKYSEEIRTINTKSDNIEIMMGNEADKTIEELF